jgi:formylglycine-generating enzyme required for sulfatase activity
MFLIGKIRSQKWNVEFTTLLSTSSEPRLISESALAFRRPRRVMTNIGLKLVYIPPGSFSMGAAQGKLGARPAETSHKVTISKGF